MALFLAQINETVDPNDLYEFLNLKLATYPPILQRHFTIKVRDTQPDFRVMQWNMLARALCIPETDTEKNSFVYDWSNYRLWRSLQEITRYNSDLICMQEVDAYEEIKPFMHAIGYTSIFHPKFSSPCLQFEQNIGPDGCAIFYRKSAFRIHNMSCEKLIINSDITPQVFIILQLTHKLTNRLVTIICLHLKSNAFNFERRRQQVEKVLIAIGLHCSQLDIDKHPILVCGDFNGEPFESFYDLVVTDKVVRGLKDAYMVGKDGEKEATTVKFRDGEMIRRAIDYVFFKSVDLVGVLELGSGEVEALPNGSYSSDHLSLVCDFKFMED